MAAINVLTPYGAGLFQSWLSARTLSLGIGSGIANGQLTEFTDAGYVRQPLALMPNGPMSGNIMGINFGPAPAAGWAVIAAGIFDGTGGQAICVGAFDEPLATAAGFNLTFNAGALTFLFNNPV